MKTTSDQDLEDDLRPEYEFRQLRAVALGPGRKASQGMAVEPAPDVAAAHPDTEGINQALEEPTFDEGAMWALVG